MLPVLLGEKGKGDRVGEREGSKAEWEKGGGGSGIKRGGEGGIQR